MANRNITIKKSDLLSKILENKNEHIKDYEQAVEAYKKEASRQLHDQLQKLEKGSLNVKINLVTPVNRSEHYDRLIQMFTWEVEPIVVLTKTEFDEYIMDDEQTIKMAKLSNSTYR